jgi:hypothetical protein
MLKAVPLCLRVSVFKFALFSQRVADTSGSSTKLA